MALPTKIVLEIVTPEGLLLREEVDDVVAPGEEGYFGVLPGHAPFLPTPGQGELGSGRAGVRRFLTCFWGFCEVLPDRVNVLADIGERAEDIDIGRAEQAKTRAGERLKVIREEEGFKEAQASYIRAVTRLAVARKQRA